MDLKNIQNFFIGKDKTPFNTKQPFNTPGGLGKEIKGNMQGTNILGRLEMTIEDSRKNVQRQQD